MRRRSVRHLFYLFLCGPAALLSLSCTGTPPETTYAQTVLSYVEDRKLEEIYEKLTIRVHVQDPDGIDDLERLHVTHDGERYVWTFEEDRWTRRREGDKEVFVLDGIVSPDGTSLPRGEYRVIAVDSAGHQAETSVSLDSEPADRETLTFPRLELDGERLAVLGDHGEARVLGYEDRSRRLGELEISRGETRRRSQIDWLVDRRGEVSLFVIARDPRNDRYMESGPYRW